MCHVYICKKKRASRSSSFSAAARRSSPRLSRRKPAGMKTLRKRKTDRPSFRFQSKSERHFWRFPVGQRAEQSASSIERPIESANAEASDASMNGFAMGDGRPRVSMRDARGAWTRIGARRVRGASARAARPRVGAATRHCRQTRCRAARQLATLSSRRKLRDCLLAKLAREKAQVFEKITRETSVCVCFQSRENAPLRKISLNPPAKI